MLLFSPITAIVHGISRLAASQSHTEALSSLSQLENGEEQCLGDNCYEIIYVNNIWIMYTAWL